MNSLLRPFSSRFGLATGHVWTVSSFVTRGRSVPWLVEPRELSIEVDSDLGPPVSLRAALHAVPLTPAASRPLLVLIHGLGGNAESGYMRDVTNAALARNLSTLRVNLRGADEQGWDFYHAGLTDDILRVLEAPHLADFDSIAVFGISLGGHVTLRTAGDARLPARVKSVAALCPPLDLEAAVAAFDTPSQWVYRRHVLGGLKQMYRRFASHAGENAHKRNLPSWSEANAITRIRDWDEKIVAPRHGFANATTYYHSQRVSTRLHEVNVPSLVVTTRWDPMVPHTTTAATLKGTPLGDIAGGDSRSSLLGPQRGGLSRAVGLEQWSQTRVFPKLVHWELPSGGHVAWPVPRPPQRSVIEHVLDWLWAPSGTDERSRQ